MRIHINQLIMTTLYDPQSPKKATNLSINSDLPKKAKELDINLSAAFEQSLIRLVTQRQAGNLANRKSRGYQFYTIPMSKSMAFSAMVFGISNAAVLGLRK